jgi:hypothetical protein
MEKQKRYTKKIYRLSAMHYEISAASQAKFQMLRLRRKRFINEHQDYKLQNSGCDVVGDGMQKMH